MLFRSKKYKVTLLGKAGLLYSEGKKKMTMDSELLVDPSGVVIYTESINLLI